MRIEENTNYACPDCGVRGLTVSGVTKGDGGMHRNSGGATYAIKQGIRRFVEPENHAARFGFHWNRHALTQLDRFTGRTVSRDRLFQVTGWARAHRLSIACF